MTHLKSKVLELSEENSRLNRRAFKLDNFKSDEDIQFYTGFPSYAAFLAAFNYLNPGEHGENIVFWRSVVKEVALGYYEQDSEKDPRRRSRTNSSIDEFFFCNVSTEARVGRTPFSTFIWHVTIICKQNSDILGQFHVPKIWSVKHLAFERYNRQCNAPRFQE